MHFERQGSSCALAVEAIQNPTDEVTGPSRCDSKGRFLLSRGSSSIGRGHQPPKKPFVLLALSGEIVAELRAKITEWRVERTEQASNEERHLAGRNSESVVAARSRRIARPSITRSGWPAMAMQRLPYRRWVRYSPLVSHDLQGAIRR